MSFGPADGLIAARVAHFGDLLRAELQKDSRALAGYLFGSVLEERFREDSDVDCAIMLCSGVGMDDLERFQYAGLLSGVVGRPVDVGIIGTHNLVYAMQAVSRGHLIFCWDEAEKDRRVMHLYGLYAQLREERWEVEKAYASR